MEQVDLKGFLTKDSGQPFDVLQKKGPDAHFYNSYWNQFMRFVRLSARHIPPQTPTRTIEREGTTGVLPSPGKRIVAGEALAGLPLSPLKVSQEDIVTGEPVRIVDEVTFHIVVEANHVDLLHQATRRAVGNTLLSAFSLQRAGELKIPPSDIKDIAIKVKRAKTVLHLITRNALGTYNLDDLPITDASSARKALSVYQNRLNGTLDAPSGNPQDDYVTHELIRQHIQAAIKKDSGPGKFSLPVVVMPKEYQSPWIQYNSFHTIHTPLSSDANPGQIIMLVNSSEPVVGAYRWHGNFKEI